MYCASPAVASALVVIEKQRDALYRDPVFDEIGGQTRGAAGADVLTREKQR